MKSDINLNLYKVFYHVAINNSFKQASIELHVSQPAISKQIRNLEELLNVKLFFRYNKGIELTNEGKILLEQLEKVDYYLGVSEKSIESYKNLEYGEMTIGCQSHIVSFFLLDYIEEFRKAYPNIHIRIISDSTSKMLDGLRHHKIDFVIDNGPVYESTKYMVVDDLATFDTIFISNNEYKEKIKCVQDLAGKDFVLPLSRGSMRKRLNDALIKYNINYNVVLAVDTTDLIIASVERGIGIGYVVKKSVEKQLKKKTIKELKIDMDLPKFELKLIYSQDYLSHQAKKFIKEYIKK